MSCPWAWPRRRRAIVLLALCCAGCGERGPHVVPVSGTVTRHGKPVENVVVHFVPENGRESWGATDPAGHYTLHYDRQREGAVTGKHRVWVEVRPKNPKEEAALAAGTLPLHPQIDQILAKYGDRQNSPLFVEVQDGEPALDLKLD